MDNGVSLTGDLLRMIGFMAICVGLAWAVQILGFHGNGTARDRLVWVLGAATIAGAGVGALYTAASLRDDDRTAHV